LGVNEYEGRAYLGLLERGPMTAYELGRHTGVPLSRCYEVARALVRKGLALVQPGDAPRYRAADPAEVLARRRAERASELDALEAEPGLGLRSGLPRRVEEDRLEAPQELGDPQADPAEADDPDSAAGELTAEKLGRIPAGPAARTHDPLALAEPPRRGEHQGDSELRGRVREDVRRVRDHHAPLAAGLEIDVVVPDGEVRDEPK
jgi:hypothetical protein